MRRLGRAESKGGCLRSREGETSLRKAWGTDRTFLFSGTQKAVWPTSTSAFWELAKKANSKALPTESATLGTRHSHLDCKQPQEALILIQISTTVAQVLRC